MAQEQKTYLVSVRCESFPFFCKSQVSPFRRFQESTLVDAASEDAAKVVFSQTRLPLIKHTLMQQCSSCISYGQTNLSTPSVIELRDVE